MVAMIVLTGSSGFSKRLIMHIVPVGAIVGPARLVQEDNSASDRLDNVWLVNTHVDSDSHWTVY